MNQKEKLTCNFCGKSQDQVRKLVAGPGIYICDECIELCAEIVEESLGSNAQPQGDEPEIFVVLNDGKVESAVLSSDVALAKVFEVSGEATVKIFSGFSGQLKTEMKKGIVQSYLDQNQRYAQGDWTSTDTLQWVRRIGEDIFHVLDGTKNPDGGYTLTDIEVDLTDYDENKLNELVQGYYDDLNHLKESSEDQDWKLIVAEIVAEQSTDPQLNFKDFEEFSSHLMEKYSITADEQ